MLWLDISFVKLISSRLAGFVIKNNTPFLANCRCPICGDSQKKSSKKRGYFFETSDHLSYKCHNCDASYSFDYFLKIYDPNLYSQYKLEKYKNGSLNNKNIVSINKISEVFEEKTSIKHESFYSGLRSIVELDDNHPVKQYVKKRRIPENKLTGLFYVPKFFLWANKKFNKFTEDVIKKFDHPRLIFVWTQNNKPYKISARSFGTEQPKYINLTYDNSIKAPYGIDSVDISKTIYVLEGQIDSLFVPNSVAIGNSKLYTFDNTNLDLVYIPDKDIRNKQIINVVDKLISMNKKICLIPAYMKGKDINEIVINHNLNQEHLVSLIQENTFSGIEAKLNFIKWSKL